jgi:hypothetical protein
MLATEVLQLLLSSSPVIPPGCESLHVTALLSSGSVFLQSACSWASGQDNPCRSWASRFSLLSFAGNAPQESLTTGLIGQLEPLSTKASRCSSRGVGRLGYRFKASSPLIHYPTASHLSLPLPSFTLSTSNPWSCERWIGDCISECSIHFCFGTLQNTLP